MKTIQELSAQLTNQIAAGEVIERPSSVVKELIENAIDAGASQLIIEVEEAGLKKIQVTDNGRGMGREDAELAFKRHATSKIKSSHDLFRIQTLGFRGEALASIASVAKVVMQTAEAGQEGTEVTLEGGNLVAIKPGISRQGTRLCVTDLFFNTPARLKFVKSLQTELSHISQLVGRLAIGHPDIAFELIHDQKRLLKTMGNGNLRQAVAGVYGPKIARQLVYFENSDSDFHIEGYTSLPELTRSNRSHMSLFINQRHIKNYRLSQAITRGYQSKLMINRYPIAILKVSVDFLLVDVNVHPSKQEVRISKETQLAELIEKAINQTMQTINRIPDALGDYSASGEEEELDRLQAYQDRVNQAVTFPRSQPVRHQQASLDLSSMPARIADQAELEWDSKQVVQSVLQPVWEEKPTDQVSDWLVAESLPQTPIPKPPQTKTQSANQWITLADRELKQAPPKKGFPDLHYIGQMHGTYLFCQNELGLYIVDQHAAQERIKFEYYRQAILEIDQHLQVLLVPLVIELTKEEMACVMDRLACFQAVGVDFEQFGGQSLMVQAVPTWFESGKETALIQQMVEMVVETGSISIEKMRLATAIMWSCKRSIKANHHLSKLQAEQLLRDLSRADNPYNCPHGRPTLIHFSTTAIEKMFKRIQDH